MNLVSLIAVMPNFFSATQDMLMAIKSFIEGTCIYMEKGKRFIFLRYFNVMHFHNVIVFRWRTFSWVALLNWFTKSSKFEGFDDSELSWSFSRSFHYAMLLSLGVFAT